MSLVLHQDRSVHLAVACGNLMDIKASELNCLLESLYKKNGSHSPEQKEDSSSKLFVLTTLSYMFDNHPIIQSQNQEVYAICRKLVLDESFFMLLVNDLFDGDSFFTHIASKCIGSLLCNIEDEDILKMRFKVLIDMFQTTDTFQEQNIYLWIFSYVLSQKPEKDLRNPVKNILVLMLETKWSQIICTTLSRQSCGLDTGKNCVPTYSSEQIMPLLILWKKLIKYEIKSVLDGPGRQENISTLNLIKDNPSVLLDVFDAGLDHLSFRKVFDILCTALGPYEFLDQPNEQFSLLAEGFLGRIQSGLMESLPSSFKRIGFGGSTCIVAGKGDNGTCDYVLLRKLCLAVLKSAAVLLQSGGNSVIVMTSLQNLEKYLKTMLPVPDNRLNMSFFHLFADQDDGLIAAALLTLFIHQQWKRASASRATVIDSIQPHEIFIDFLKSISYDHSILLDLLTSPETCFLTYLTKYLQVVSADWTTFTETTKRCSAVLAENESSMIAELYDSDSDVSYYSQDSKSLGSINELQSTCTREEKAISSCGFVSDKLLESNTANGDICKIKRTELSEIVKVNVLNLVAYSSSEDSDSDDPSCQSKCVTSLECMNLSDQMSVNGDEASTRLLNEFENNQKTVVSPQFKVPTAYQKIETNDIGGQESGVPEISVLPVSAGCADAGEERVDNALDDLADEKSMDAEDSYASKADAVLEQTMTTLIRLRLAIERLHSNDLFPYNPTVLMNLIETCEDLYEN